MSSASRPSARVTKEVWNQVRRRFIEGDPILGKGEPSRYWPTLHELADNFGIPPSEIMKAAKCKDSDGETWVIRRAQVQLEFRYQAHEATIMDLAASRIRRFEEYPPRQPVLSPAQLETVVDQAVGPFLSGEIDPAHLSFHLAIQNGICRQLQIALENRASRESEVWESEWDGQLAGDPFMGEHLLPRDEVKAHVERLVYPILLHEVRPGALQAFLEIHRESSRRIQTALERLKGATGHTDDLGDQCGRQDQ